MSQARCDGETGVVGGRTKLALLVVIAHAALNAILLGMLLDDLRRKGLAK